MSRSSSVSLPHCSFTLPFICFQLLSNRFQSIFGPPHPLGAAISAPQALRSRRSAAARRPLAAVLELRRRLQLVLCSVHAGAPDLVGAVIGDRHRAWIDRHVACSQSEESSDRKDVPGHLAFLSRTRRPG